MASKQPPIPSQAELREQFIKSLIQLEFGTAMSHFDPEAGLAKMRELDRLTDKLDSDVYPIINSVGLNTRDSRELKTTLDQACEEVRSEIALSRVKAHDESGIQGVLVSSLVPEGQRCYLDENGCPVIVYTLPGKPMLAITLEYVLSRTERCWVAGPLNRRIVTSLVIGTWRYGESRRAIARETVCRQVESLIRNKRDIAERLYAEAVAVRSDVSEIIQAAHIVIFEGTTHEPRAVVYPTSAFRLDKIIVPAKRHIPIKKIRSSAQQLLTAQGIAPLVVKMLDSDALRTIYNAVAGELVFLCHKSACGFEPEGGQRLL